MAMYPRRVRSTRKRKTSSNAKLQLYATKNKIAYTLCFFASAICLVVAIALPGFFLTAPLSLFLAYTTNYSESTIEGSGFYTFVLMSTLILILLTKLNVTVFM